MLKKWKKHFQKEIYRQKSVSKNLCGKIVKEIQERSISARIHAEQLCTNFGKDLCGILTRFRCAQIQ